MFKFLAIIIKFFEENQIPYMLSGSVAMSIYAIPRSTRDIDFVASIRKDHVEKIVNFFRDGYYCDEDAILESIKARSIFNIIDYASGFKADFVILKDDSFRLNEFHRRQKHIFEGYPVYVVTVEDLLISKLIWIQDYQSPVQMEDISTLWELDSMDKEYVNQWVKDLKLNTFKLLA